jgi:hypothetical protein
MAATKNEISQWFDNGVNNPEKPTHMIVVCDTYEYDDYPVYVNPSEDVQKIYEKYNGPNMQRVIEVYNLKEDKTPQMAVARAMRF